jgi:hypothetical protein
MNKPKPSSRTHWLSVIFWLLEQRWPTLLAIPTLIAGVSTLVAGGGVVVFALTWAVVPLAGIGVPVCLAVYRSGCGAISSFASASRGET